MNLLLEQISNFLYMLLLGLGLGLLFDLYRRVSLRFKRGRLIIKISDFFLGILAGVGGFMLLLQANWGELRFYIIISIITGFFLYYYLLKLVGLSKKN